MPEPLHPAEPAPPATLADEPTILGIESSCDETAAAVVRGGQVLSSVVASQVDLHALYGGVVPELASREHLRNVVPVVRAAVAEAGLTLAEIDAVAVTEGPGLAGALLVGIVYAKSLAFALGKPLVAVNHLEGHIHAVLLEHAFGPGEAPLLALVVSGGHTHLYLARETGEPPTWHYRVVGRTVDDAAGEAFDKVAKLLGLPYPGGPWIDRLAPLGDARAVPFHFGPIKPRPGAPAESTRFDFSFSGIKTAVLRYVQTHGMEAECAQRRATLAGLTAPTLEEVAAACPQPTLDLLASFQAAVVGNLLRQSFAAAAQFGARGLLVSGGVAANRELRRRFAAEGEAHGLPVAFPTPALSTDNAAMIAAAAAPRLRAGQLAPDTLAAAPQLPLG